jgi:hypothetical protein
MHDEFGFKYYVIFACMYVMAGPAIYIPSHQQQLFVHEWCDSWFPMDDAAEKIDNKNNLSKKYVATILGGTIYQNKLIGAAVICRSFGSMLQQIHRALYTMWSDVMISLMGLCLCLFTMSLFYVIMDRAPEWNLYNARRKVLISNQPILTTKLRTLLRNELPSDAWSVVFGFLDLKDNELMELRYQCSLFRDAITGTKTLFKYIEVPSMFPTIDSALIKLSTLHGGPGVFILVDSGTWSIHSGDLDLALNTLHIEIVGAGIGKTIVQTIHIPVRLGNSLSLRHLTLTTNPTLPVQVPEENVDCAVFVGSSTCVIDSCEIYGYIDGVYVNGVDSSVKLIDCVIHSNKSSGILASDRSTVDIFGLKSDVKHNGRSGIRCQDQSTVNIHLPKVHRTAHDNGGKNYDKTSDSTINIDV